MHVRPWNDLHRPGHLAALASHDRVHPARPAREQACESRALGDLAIDLQFADVIAKRRRRVLHFQSRSASDPARRPWDRGAYAIGRGNGETGAVACPCRRHPACRDRNGQTPLIIGDGAGAQRAGQEGKLVAHAVGVGPDQGLRARRFIDVLDAAIGEGMQREAVAVPAQGSVRAFGPRPEDR